MASDLNLAVRVSAVDLATPGLSKIDYSLKGLANSLKDVSTVAGGFLLGGIFTQIEGGLADKLKEVVTQTTSFGEATFQLRSVIGGTAESSSQLLAVFQRMGVSVDDASRNLGIFSKHLAGIETGTDALVVGTKTFNEHMKDLGVTFQDAAGKSLPMNDVLLNVSDKFAKMPDGVEKTALALALFGRAGRDMIPILDLGSKGIEEAEAAAAKYGLTLTGANVQAVRDYAFAHKDLDEAIQGMSISVGTMMMPALVQMAQGTAKAAQEFNTNLIPAIKATNTEIQSDADVWIQAFNGVAGTVERVGVALTPLTNLLGGQAAVMGTLTYWWGQYLHLLNEMVNPLASFHTATTLVGAALGITGPAVQNTADKMDIMRMAAESSSGGVNALSTSVDALTTKLSADQKAFDDWTKTVIQDTKDQLAVQAGAEKAVAAGAQAEADRQSKLHGTSLGHAAEMIQGASDAMGGNTNAIMQNVAATDAANKRAEAAALAQGKFNKSLSGTGQSALTAIAGLSQLDMVIAGTSQKLAGVQLQIEQKVLSRMEARGAPRTLYGQEALLQEQLKVENLQKAAGFTVSQEQLKISNAQAKGGGHTVHIGDIHVTTAMGQTANEIATGAGHHVTVAVLNALNGGGKNTPGKANTQLAGAR